MLNAVKHACVAAVAIAMFALPVRAQVGDPDLTELMTALHIAETIDIMRDEGLKYGGDLAADMLPDADPAYWNSVVARIYDTDKLNTLVVEGFRQELGDADIAPILDFYQSDLGQEVVRLELGARRAFMDSAIEEAAQERYQQLEADNAAILDRIETIIADSDLVEFNVMGALNANLMFFRGLNESDVYDMSEEEMLNDVWSQEEDVRDDTQDWLNAFLLMAYQPLEPDQLDQYGAFYQTSEGRALNRTMFKAFDRMYGEVSYLLGLAVAHQMHGEDI